MQTEWISAVGRLPFQKGEPIAITCMSCNGLKGLSSTFFIECININWLYRVGMNVDWHHLIHISHITWADGVMGLNYGQVFIWHR